MNLPPPLYHIGIADQDLSDEQKAQLQGKVALIDRGQITFVAKIDRALAAGAIGVVMVNNIDGTPIRMGGEKEYEIPAVMISKQAGRTNQDSTVGKEKSGFLQAWPYRRKARVDRYVSWFLRRTGRATMTRYSSQRLPHLGVGIISAFAGHGERGIQVNGTSMAAPHVSGVVALLRQYHPSLEPTLFKSLLTARAKIMHATDGTRYRTYQQGGGTCRGSACRNC